MADRVTVGSEDSETLSPLGDKTAMIHSRTQDHTLNQLVHAVHETNTSTEHQQCSTPASTTVLSVHLHLSHHMIRRKGPSAAHAHASPRLIQEVFWKAPSVRTERVNHVRFLFLSCPVRSVGQRRGRYPCIRNGTCPLQRVFAKCFTLNCSTCG